MDVNKFGEGVALFMRETYRKFAAIRSKHRDDIIDVPFWDVVVLTASDADQKLAYESQLAGKLRRREIPRGVDYLVFADPPGPKIGCGGATMHVVAQLTDIYAERLDALRILLINAGGQSQRLASASALGKVFTALPMGDPPWQVLELKLAAYLPLLARMGPGYLHAASDTVEVFDLRGGEGSDGREFPGWNFRRPGLTALAHPSGLGIGSTHGVFVFGHGPSPATATAEFRTCIEVLQKPSVDVMRRKGAVLRDGSSEEIVYTDSLYYFDHGFARRLLEFFRAECPLLCEIDGYGDFMQPLGENASEDFACDTRNVTDVNDHLVPTRLRLYRHLRGSPFHVVAADASRFFHVGTTREYLHNFGSDADLATYAGFEDRVFLEVPDGFVNGGRVVHAILRAPAIIGHSSVVEYCRFDAPLIVGPNCIVSHCSSKSGVIVPPNTFLHTVPLRPVAETSRGTEYATLVFHIDDDVKAKAGVEALSSLKFLARPLSETVAGSVSDATLFSADASGQHVRSLWFARFFAVKSSMHDAFDAALRLAIGNKKLDYGLEESAEFVSAFEVFWRKDVRSMLDYVEQLRDSIRH